MKVALVCVGGMSSSMIMLKMKKYAAENHLDGFEIEATGTSDLGPAKRADVVLLGPQVVYQVKNIHRKIGDKPVAMIPMKEYGRGDCPAIFALIEKTLAEASAEAPGNGA